MIRIVFVAVTSAALAAGLAGGGASADSSSAVCGFPPGTIHSLFAQDTPGPNAGPKAEIGWGVEPGTPNAPGQVVRFGCV